MGDTHDKVTVVSGAGDSGELESEGHGLEQFSPTVLVQMSLKSPGWTVHQGQNTERKRVNSFLQPAGNGDNDREQIQALGNEAKRQCLRRTGTEGEGSKDVGSTDISQANKPSQP